MPDDPALGEYRELFGGSIGSFGEYPMPVHNGADVDRWLLTDLGRGDFTAAASRVWLEGEDSDEWHPSYGGGLAFEVAGSPVVFWTGAARAREQDDLWFYFLGGFGF